MQFVLQYSHVKVKADLFTIKCIIKKIEGIRHMCKWPCQTETGKGGQQDTVTLLEFQASADEIDEIDHVHTATVVFN